MMGGRAVAAADDDSDDEGGVFGMMAGRMSSSGASGGGKNRKVPFIQEILVEAAKTGQLNEGKKLEDIDSDVSEA